MFLKLKDTKVLYFDLDEFVVEVLREDLLPFGIRGKLKEVNDVKTILGNVDVIREWLSSRVLSLSRDNSKDIFALFGFDQSNSISVRVDICLKCRALSLIDSYWIGEENEKWSDFNLRTNQFKEIVDIALCGEKPSVTTDKKNPELTSKGLFRKAWIRENNELFMLKSDKLSGNENTVAEVICSEILSWFEVDGKPISKVDYELDWVKNSKVAKCKCFVGEKYSFVEARYVQDYCRCCGISYEKFCIDRFGYDFLIIPIVDYILINTDRHSENYGFFMDNDIGELVNLAPLFDHNLALIGDLLEKNVEDTLSQMISGYSLKSLKDRYLKLGGSEYFSLDVDRVRYLKKKFPSFGKAIEGVVRRYLNVKGVD